MPLPSMKVNIPSRELSVSTPTKQRNQPQRVILFALSNPPVARKSSRKMVSCAFIKLHLITPTSTSALSRHALVSRREQAFLPLPASHRLPSFPSFHRCPPPADRAFLSDALPVFLRLREQPEQRP